MLKYKVVKGYSKTDNTVNSSEIVEYPVYKDIETFKDARKLMKALAMKEDICVRDFWNALNETITVDEETGITTLEKEWLRIEVT